MIDTNTNNIHGYNEVPICFTPRQLINHHIKFPEDPITDSDIENLILGISAVNLKEHEINKNFILKANKTV